MGRIVMNENIDLMKILDGCPKGTKLYSPVCGKVEFEGITNDPDFSIICKGKNTGTVIFVKTGQYFTDGECLLFPSKEQRDWSKFERFWDKPKMERFSPKTLQPFDRVLVRYNDDDKWDCDLFSYYDGGQSYPYVCVSKLWSHCIPYNNETKHLVGTTDDCPEYYKCGEE